jgi:hypothetical protein
VAYNRFPAQDDFDFRSNQNNAINELKICSSSLYAGTWRIGVQNWGFAAQNFSLFSSLIGAAAWRRCGRVLCSRWCAVVNCPGMCSGHGRCNIEGTCTCSAGYASGGAWSVSVRLTMHWRVLQLWRRGLLVRHQQRPGWHHLCRYAENPWWGG